MRSTASDMPGDDVSPTVPLRRGLTVPVDGLALRGLPELALGLGASSKYLVESVNGQSLDSPVSTMERTLDYLRAVFEGQRVDGGFRLQVLADKPIPIVLAPLRGRMLSLAAERADGAFTNFLPISAVPRLVGPGNKVTVAQRWSWSRSTSCVRSSCSVPSRPSSNTSLASRKRGSRPLSWCFTARRSRSIRPFPHLHQPD